MESSPDVVVVGAPRSGTSLVCQLLAAAGHRFGSDLLGAASPNPNGFFEDVGVTDLNDRLLAPHVVGDRPGAVPVARLAWLAVPDAAVQVDAGPEVHDEMAALLPPAPAALKDPRLTVTLDAWRPALRPNTVFVGVVRHPAEVCDSLLAMAEQDLAYYEPLPVDADRAFALWAALNRRVLELTHEGTWHIVDHARLLDGTALPALSSFVGRPLDAGVVDPLLHRNRSRRAAPDALLRLHATLLDRAADLELGAAERV